ncbi:MAG: hypothetical protein GX282_00740 [Campylobacteraceae bacterium]|nr:hypothetical protein [Campylobacteraceae bacterium]
MAKLEVTNGRVEGIEKYFSPTSKLNDFLVNGAEIKELKTSLKEVIKNSDEIVVVYKKVGSKNRALAGYSLTKCQIYGVKTKDLAFKILKLGMTILALLVLLLYPPFLADMGEGFFYAVVVLALVSIVALFMDTLVYLKARKLLKTKVAEIQGKVS